MAHRFGTTVWNERGVRVWLAGLLLLCFLYFPPRPGDWNPNSRLDEALAIVNHATFAIDPYSWNAHADQAWYRGHAYSNKAPGMTFLAIPVYLTFKGVLHATGHGREDTQLGTKQNSVASYFLFYILTILESWIVVAIPTMLFLLFFHWFLAALVDSLLVRTLVTLGLGIATGAFPYTLTYFPHLPAMALVFLAFALIYVSADEEARRRLDPPGLFYRPSALVLAGAALGGAFLIDHTMALAVAVLPLYALVRHGIRGAAILGACALPGLLLALGYDKLVFASAATTGYNVTGPGIGHSDSAWPPHGYAPFGLTFSPYRGIFFLSPFLLLAFPGLYIWARRRVLEPALCAALAVIYIIFISTVTYWDGGYSVGPRYLIVILPFLAMSAALAMDRFSRTPWRFLTYGLLALSIAETWIETIAGLYRFPPTGIADPLFDYSLPLLARGEVRFSLGTFLIGPFTGYHSILTVLPLGVLVAAWSLYRLRGHAAAPAAVRVEADRSA